MRDSITEQVLESEGDELLTTGEAAKILNSSRQHVVDLCNRGDLPYTTVGTHRRIRRRDIEAHRTRTSRMSRDQRRSLWLAHAIAGEIAREPERALSLADENLQRMEERARGQAARWLEEWSRLLTGPVQRMLTELTSPSPKGRELRQNNPFAGVLRDTDRDLVLEAWRLHDRPSSS
jgi:excisionase family DNA binding protein